MKDAAKIYGEALYELARSEELDGQLLPQLRGAAELLTGAPEYQYILSSPAISKAERTGAAGGAAAEALRRHRKDHPADLPDRPGLPGRRPCGNGRPAAGRHRPQTSGGYE